MGVASVGLLSFSAEYNKCPFPCQEEGSCVMTEKSVDVRFVDPSDEVFVHLPDGRVLAGKRGTELEAFMKTLENWRDPLIVGAIVNRELRELSYKIWLDHRGKAFGDGPYELLRRVDKTKSLHQAAHEMGMAYSKAWSLIRTLEQRLGFSLLERKTGGASGGGSRVTPEGKELMRVYGRFRKEVKGCMEAIYRKHFGNSKSPRSLFS